MTYQLTEYGVDRHVSISDPQTRSLASLTNREL